MSNTESSRRTYWYTGPMELGSVVAHQCGAVGLFSSKISPTFYMYATVDEATLSCTVEIRVQDENAREMLSPSHAIEGNASTEYERYGLLERFTAPYTIEGRKELGRQILSRLRTFLGIHESPWGSLVGVRPTKLVHKLWDTHASLEKVEEILQHTYGISDEKVHLLEQVASIERTYVKDGHTYPRRISVYSGIPFCETHCTYCSFPYGLIQSYGNVERFLCAYERDMDHMKAIIHHYDLDVADLYMGGGTPTSLSDRDFHRILEQLHHLVQRGREFTVEAGRPDSLNARKIETMQEFGVNRISLNPQTMDDDILCIIGRGHKVQDFMDMYEYVRHHTDFTVNMDFIAGLPRQTMIHMERNRDYIKFAKPHNVTVHTLALKRGSPLYRSPYSKETPPEEEVQRMLSMMHEELLHLGYVPYYMYRQQYMVGQMENVGYTLPGYECSYNIHMMEERQTTLSIGPGSASKWIYGETYRQRKQHMPKDVDTYCDDIERLLDKRRELSDLHWRNQ